MHRLALGALMGLMMMASGAARAKDSFVLDSASKLSIEGDSTLHKWSARARVVKLTTSAADSTDGATADVEAAIRAGHFKGAELSVPAAGLTSGEDGLDDNMRKALKAGPFPSIVFHIDTYEALPPTADSELMKLDLHGTLTIAGVARPVDVIAQVSRATSGVRIQGSKLVRMTDFKVEPPVLMFGAIKTADQVEVKFELVLRSVAGSSMEAGR
ncbi:MAG: YceI family protein [Deltaproteobacteria bacterium]|nr:YceI family protein [Deltaproteobacteria bacterium]